MRNRVHAIFILIIFLLGEAFIINGIQIKIKNRIYVDNKEIGRVNTIEEHILSDIKSFPIASAYKNKVSFEDSYGAYRESGGHEGCDIMSDENVPGEIPVVSATDGVITNIGWLYLGGYRIGITSKNGIYYYYAHLDSYANGLSVGKEIRAGEFLGFMGNTGEGEEGTEGKFPVHLHFGIYIYDENGNEECVNSYPFLLKINR